MGNLMVVCPTIAKRVAFLMDLMERSYQRGNHIDTHRCARLIARLHVNGRIQREEED